MTSDGITAPPEGRLLRSVRERAIPKISIRAAAARIRISPEHWGNIERGYKSVSAGEPPQPVPASAELLAKMASAVGVTPEQLETEGKRPDAAQVMRGRREERPSPPRAAPESDSGPYAAIDEIAAVLYAPVVRKRLHDVTKGSDLRPTGEAMFDPDHDPLGMGEYTAAGVADGWDEGMRRGLDMDVAVKFAARAWAILARYEAGERARSSGQSGALAPT